MQRLLTALVIVVATGCQDRPRPQPDAKACSQLLALSSADSCHAGDQRLTAALGRAELLGPSRWSCLSQLAHAKTPDRGVRAAVLARAFANEPEIHAAWLAHHDPALRAAAAASLLLTPAEQARPHLLSLLGDRSPLVRVEALGVLARQSPPPSLRAEVEPLLADASPAVRGAAASVLASGGIVASAPALLALLDDREPDVVVHAIYALKALGITGARERMHALESADSQRVRTAATLSMTVLSPQRRGVP